MENIPVNINVTSDGSEPIEIKPIEMVIRNGAAEVIEPPVPLRFTGHLFAPADWMQNKNSLGLLDKNNCHLEVNEEQGSVKFISTYRDKYQDNVTGTLIESRVIKAFHINDVEKMWSDKELAKFFRQNVFFFENKDLNKKIVEKLMCFTASVDRKITNDQDLKGNKKLGYEQFVKTDIPESFVMKAPLFDGYPDETFEVFICSECESVGVKFYLESVDLFRLIEERKRELLGAEIKKFKEFGCAVITK